MSRQCNIDARLDTIVNEAVQVFEAKPHLFRAIGAGDESESGRFYRDVFQLIQLCLKDPNAIIGAAGFAELLELTRDSKRIDGHLREIDLEAANVFLSDSLYRYAWIQDYDRFCPLIDLVEVAGLLREWGMDNGFLGGGTESIRQPLTKIVLVSCYIACRPDNFDRLVDLQLSAAEILISTRHNNDAAKKFIDSVVAKSQRDRQWLVERIRGLLEVTRDKDAIREDDKADAESTSPNESKVENSQSGKAHEDRSETPEQPHCRYANSALDEFVGSEVLLKLIDYKLQRTRQFKQPLPHCLFTGSRGMGKRTMAGIIATALGTEFQIADCRTLKAPRDILPYLTNASYGSVLLLQNAEAITKSVQAFIEPAATDFRVDMTLGDGLNARKINMKLQPFTIIFTTETLKGVPEFVKTFFDILEFTVAPPEAMARLICRHIKKLPLELALAIATECDLKPANAVTTTRRLIDYGNAVANGRLSKAIIRQAIGVLGIQPSRTGNVSSFGVLESTYDPALIDMSRQEWKSLRGTDFELFLTKGFQRLGFAVSQTPVTGDQGVDLVAARGQFRLAIQAKGYAVNVGNDAVQQVFAGMKYYDCNACAVITNSRFTPQARQLAKKLNCILVGENDLLALLAGEFTLEELNSHEHQ